MEDEGDVNAPYAAAHEANYLLLVFTMSASLFKIYRNFNAITSVFQKNALKSLYNIYFIVFYNILLNFDKVNFD